MFLAERKCINQMYGLLGKVVLITGAGRRKGIGAAIAEKFFQCGAKVFLTDIGFSKSSKFSEDNIGTYDELKAVAHDIGASSENISFNVCDVLNEDEVIKTIELVVKKYGKLDVIVNNAGVGYLMGRIVNFSKEDWDTVVNVNLRGAFFGIKHGAKQMIFQGEGGRIINIASQASKRGFVDLAAYVSSKHGVVGLTRTAAIEFGKFGITVNSVCPNHITTGLGSSQNHFRANELGITVEELLEKRGNQIPLGRVGKVEDVSDLCIFLSSNLADYITGQNLDISGGQEMH